MESTDNFYGKEIKAGRETGREVFFTQKDNGAYACEIRNSYGDVESAAVRMTSNQALEWFSYQGIENIQLEESNLNNNGRNLLNEDDTSKNILEIKEEVQIGNHVLKIGDKIRVLNENAYEIILQQLGGNKFIAMTGAKLTHSNNGNTLTSKFKGSNKFNIIEITLNNKDLYDVRFLKMSTSYEILNEKIYNDVYHDKLGELFTLETDLYISL